MVAQSCQHKNPYFVQSKSPAIFLDRLEKREQKLLKESEKVFMALLQGIVGVVKEVSTAVNVLQRPARSSSVISEEISLSPTEGRPTNFAIDNKISNEAAGAAFSVWQERT